jgi:uncharacterized protein YycO
MIGSLALFGRAPAMLRKLLLALLAAMALALPPAGIETSPGTVERVNAASESGQAGGGGSPATAGASQATVAGPGWSVPVELASRWWPYVVGGSALAVGGDGSWHLLYAERVDVDAHTWRTFIRYVSSDGGTGTVASETGGCSGDPCEVWGADAVSPSLAVDASGALHATYERSSTDGAWGSIVYVVNAGHGWSAPVELARRWWPYVLGGSAVAVGGDGSWHLLYAERVDVDAHTWRTFIRYVSSDGGTGTVASETGGCSGDPCEVWGADAVSPSLAVDACGALHATYERSSTDGAWGSVMYQVTPDLKNGDLLLARNAKSIVPGFWSHVGLYVADGRQVVEALPGGVVTTPFQTWCYPNKTWVSYLRVVTADDPTRDAAVSFALEQASLHRPYDAMWWQKDANGESWYCSELAWAAYLHASNGQIDLEYHQPWEIWEAGITPTEIYLDDDTEVIGGHYEKLPQRGFAIWAKSPVDLRVVDPENQSVEKQLIQIPGAIYAEDYVDGDGDLQDWIGIPSRKAGHYLITVVPEPNAPPTDTYSLEVLLEDDTTVVLAENVPIGEIPAEPYVFQSVLPPPVGGIAELPNVASTPLETGGSPGATGVVLAGMAAVLAVAAGAWYARRRWSR